MSKKLIESDFLTVNLASMSTAKNTSDINANNLDLGASPDSSATTTKKQITDWDAELKNRLDANRKLSAEARLPESTIEAKLFEEFFEYFFNVKYKYNCVDEITRLGEPLNQAIKVLGFKEQINPILAFLTLKYVQDELIQTNLLNAQTFKAIYNAVANKLVADSQFFKANNYNLIYCKDLYRRSAAEMEKYLELQKEILKPSANTYTKSDFSTNKRVFLKIDAINALDAKGVATEVLKIDGADLPSMTSSNVELNNIALAKALGNELAGIKTERKQLNNSDVSDIMSKIGDSPAQIFSALMALRLTTNNADVERALKAKQFSNLTAAQLAEVAPQIAKVMPKGALGAESVKSLVQALMAKLVQ